MSTFRNPVGPQPTNVYWRRRLVVGIGLLAVIVIILLIVFAPKGGTPTGSKTPDAADPGSAQTPGATTPPVDTTTPCDTADLTVTAAADKASYSADEVPQLSFTITNDSSKACIVTGGSDVQQYVISSGDEVYWDSTDCQADPVAATTPVEAGGQVQGGPLAWPRTRSDKDTCDDTPVAAPSGDVTYSLTVTVNGVESKPVKLRLL
jgi:hypothetical protein